MTIGRRLRSANFSENLVMVSARAMVLANCIVRTASTDIHTVTPSSKVVVS